VSFEASPGQPAEGGCPNTFAAADRRTRACRL